MKLDGLFSLIHEIWSRVWPSLVYILILYYFCNLFYPSETRNMISEYANYLYEYGKKIDSLKVLLQPYGLTSLIPTICFIIIAFIIYIISGPINILFLSFPPQISFIGDSSSIPVKILSDKEKTLLIRKNPLANSVSQAYFQEKIKYSNEVKDPNPARMINSLDYFGAFLRFSITISTILYILNFSLFFKNFLIYFLHLIVQIFLLYIYILSYIFQEYQRQVNETELIKVNLEKDIKLLEEPLNEQEKELISFSLEYSGNGPWWRITLLNSYKINWFLKNYKKVAKSIVAIDRHYY